MRAQIEELAQRGEVSVSRLVEHDGQLDWPLMQLVVPVRGAQGAAGITEVPDTVAMFAWMHRDALIKKLDTEIDAEADDKAALSHDARQKAEVEVSSTCSTSRGRRRRWCGRRRHKVCRSSTAATLIRSRCLASCDRTARGRAQHDAGLVVADAAVNTENSAAANVLYERRARARHLFARRLAPKAGCR